MSSISHAELGSFHFRSFIALSQDYQGCSLRPWPRQRDCAPQNVPFLVYLASRRTSNDRDDSDERFSCIRRRYPGHMMPFLGSKTQEVLDWDSSRACNLHGFLIAEPSPCAGFRRVGLSRSHCEAAMTDALPCGLKLSLQYTGVIYFSQ